MKKFLTLLAVATLATAATSGSSAAFAENSVTGTDPAVTAPVEQPITVSVAHVHYGVGYIGYWDYTINPGETITVPAKDIPGTRPDVSQLTISYEQAKTQTQYTIVYYTVDSPTTVAPPPVITTEEPAPPVVTTAEPPVVTTTQEQPATTQATTEEEPTTTANNGGNTQTTTTEPITTTTDDGGNGGTTTTQTTTEPVVTTTNNGGGGAQNTTQEPKTTVQSPKTDAPKKDQPKAEPKAEPKTTEAPAPKQTVKPNGVAVAKTAADTAASGLTNSKSSVVGYLAAMLMAVVGFILLLGYNPKEEK